MKKVILFISFVFAFFQIKAQSWVEVNSGTHLKLNSISFGSNLVGYIGANDSTLLKTIDGGQTWNVQPTNGIHFTQNLPHIIQVDFVDALNGYLMVGHALYDGRMYKTTDGGANWTAVAIAMCAPIFNFNFDADNAMVMGSSCFGGKTIDRKINGVWQNNSTYLSWGNDYLRTATFYDQQFGMVAGDSGQVHRTMDGGLHWDTVQTLSKDIIWDLQFVNDSTIYGVIDSLSNALMISQDSGKTWVSHSNSFTFFYPQFEALALMPNEGVLAVGETFANQGMIVWGNETGPFWRKETVGQPLEDVTMSNDSTAFAVGDSGLIVVNQSLILGVKQVKTSTKFKLYPNPATEYFTIENADRTVSEVWIYDISGRLVKTIQSGYDQIHISNLEKGAYHVVVFSKDNREVHQLIVQ